MKTKQMLFAAGLVVLIVAALGPRPGVAAEKLQVVTSVPDLAWLVQEIGGDRVEVKSLCLGYQDPHYLEAKPSYARVLRKADLLVYVGLELEAAWLPRLLEAGRNPDLQPGSSHLFEAASSVTGILEVPTGTVDRSQGDIHPLGNPHFLLDPRHMVEVSRGVAEALGALDPEGREQFETARAGLEAKLAERMGEWKEKAAPLRAHPVVAFHKQWEYLAVWLELEILGYIENRPGIPPSPRHVGNLISRMQEHEVQVVMAAPFVDVHAVEEVARRGGARMAILPAAVDGVEGTNTYLDLMDEIVTRLTAAAAGEGE